jgi:hypothetical protein
VSNSPQQHLLTLPGRSDVFLALDSILTTRITTRWSGPASCATSCCSMACHRYWWPRTDPFRPRRPADCPHGLDRVHRWPQYAGAGRLRVERRAITATGDPLPPSIALFTDEDQRGGAITYSEP